MAVNQWTFQHFLFRWYIFIYVLLWLAAAPTPQSNQILQTVGGEEARGRTREHFNGLCIGGDNFLSSLAVEIVCLALWQALSPTHFGEGRGRGGVGDKSCGGHYLVAHRGSLMGCNILWHSRFSISTPPLQPPMWLSCSVENFTLKASSPWVQRPAQRTRIETSH